MKKMKAIMGAILCLCLLMGLAGCQTANPPAPAPAPAAGGAPAASGTESIDGALKGVTLKIGTDTSFVPFCYPDDNNEYTGFDIDMIKALSAKLGFEYELSPMDFTALLMSVQTNKLDIGAAGITITDERKKVMDFSDPYYDAGLLVMVNKDNTAIGGIEDLAGKNVALKEGTSSVDYVTKNIPDAEIVTFPNIEDAYLEIERGKVDAVVYDTPNILFYLNQSPNSNCKVVGGNFDACQYGYVFQKDSEYTSMINAALKEFEADGTYDRIYGTWFGSAN